MRRVITALACLVVGGVIALGWAVFSAPRLELPGTARTRIRALPRNGNADDSTSLTRWADLAPFRRSRVASKVRYDARRIVAPDAVAALPKPVLLLRGFVGGTEPAAIVEGFPGVDGAQVVRAGDRVDRLTVRRIAGGRVLIAGMDTTWTLELPRQEQ